MATASPNEVNYCGATKVLTSINEDGLLAAGPNTAVRARRCKLVVMYADVSPPRSVSADSLTQRSPDVERQSSTDHSGWG